MFATRTRVLHSLLQSELYDARTMYAEAVAVREQLEARTARAEAEKEAADNSWQQAQTQVQSVARKGGCEEVECMCMLQDAEAFMCGLLSAVGCTGGPLVVLNNANSHTHCVLCVPQAKEDGSRLSSLQEQVMSLTQQVQVLQPLQPKLSTAEVERDTALHKLERLQVRRDACL